MDSETQSDSGKSDGVPDPYDLAQCFAQTNHSAPSITLDDAIETIVDWRSDKNRLHIKAASTVLNRSLDIFYQDCGSTDNICVAIPALLLLLRHDFLSALFEVRKALRLLAKPTKLARKSILVSWADSILAKLCHAVAYISSGIYDGSSSVSKMYQEQTLVAAVQLPHGWETFHQVLVSGLATPAVRRLALQLIFGAYILRPSLLGEDIHIGWTMRDIAPFVLKYYGNFALHRKLELCAEDETACSVVLVLCSSAMPCFDGVTADSHSFISSVSACIEAVIGADFINQPNLLQTLGCPLNTGLTVLMKWGNVIPWAWTLFPDPRCAQFNMICDLTALWLYAQESYDPDVLHYDTARMHKCLTSNPSVSGIYMTQLLHRAAEILLSTGHNLAHPHLEALAIFINKLCRAFVQLCNPLSPKHIVLTARASRHLCLLFVCAGSSKDDLITKDAIVQILTYTESCALTEVAAALCDDIEFEFAKQIDEFIGRLRRACTATKGEISTATWKREVHLLLAFLTIFAHSGRQLPVYSSSLTQLIFLTSRHVQEGHYTSLAPLFLAASSGCFDKQSALNLLDLWQIHRLTIPNSAISILTASAIAGSLISDMSLLESLSVLTQAEIWDYLRDILSATLAHHYLDSHELLAFLAVPSLCHALRAILRSGSQLFVNWVRTSPWTASLCRSLESSAKKLCGFRAVADSQAASMHGLLMVFLEDLNKLRDSSTLNLGLESISVLERAPSQVIHHHIDGLLFLIAAHS